MHRILKLAALLLALWLPNEAAAQTSWQAFAKPAYNGRIGGTEPEVKQLALDFQSNESRYFQSETARQIFVATGHELRPDLVRDYESVASLLYHLPSDQIRIVSCQEAVQGQLLSALAIRGNQTTWTSRECDPDEHVLQLRTTEGWANWFSLKCLNPVAGEQTVVTLPPPQQPREECVLVSFPSNRADVVFVNPADICGNFATCQDEDCIEWMKGKRGPVPDRLTSFYYDGGRAYEVPRGATGVAVRTGDAEVWYCDQAKHGRYGAERIN